MTVTDCNTGSSLFCLFVCSWQPLPNPDVVAEMYQSAVEVKKSWHQTWKTKYTVPFLSQLFRSFLNCSDHAYYLGIHGWVMTHIWVNQVSTGTLVSLAAVIRVVTQRFSPVIRVGRHAMRCVIIEDITRWQEDMNFNMFSWQEQYLTRSLLSLVRYCSRHENIKFMFSG